jgi:hypothetical protein
LAGTDGWTATTQGKRTSTVIGEASDTRRVLPSGADLATYSAPIWRERASVAPAGEVGTTILTGREGSCWPKTGETASAHREDDFHRSLPVCTALQV